MEDEQPQRRPLAGRANSASAMSPFELPPAMIGRRPIRLQIRTGFTGPSSNTSVAACVRTVPPSSSSNGADAELPITRSGGMPYMSS